MRRARQGSSQSHWTERPPWATTACGATVDQLAVSMCHSPRTPRFDWRLAADRLLNHPFRLTATPTACAARAIRTIARTPLAWRLNNSSEDGDLRVLDCDALTPSAASLDTTRVASHSFRRRPESSGLRRPHTECRLTGHDASREPLLLNRRMMRYGGN